MTILERSRRSPWDRWPITRLGLIAQIILCVGHVGTMITGLAFFVRPTPSVTRELPPEWAAAWSSIFIVFGLLALIFRLKRAWVYEAICLAATAGGLAIWGVLSMMSTVATTGTLNALQVAIRLLVGSVILTGFALLEVEWVRLRRTASPAAVNALSRAVADHMREDRSTEDQ